MKTIDFSYFIERYNAGEMPPAEINWFEKELAGNDTLRKEVMLRKRTDQLLVQHDLISLRNRLSSIEKTREEKLIKTIGKRTVAIRYAAVFAGLVLIGSLFMLQIRNQSSEVLYNKNFSAYEFPGPSRTVQSQSDHQFGMALKYYSDKHFSDAETLLGQYLKANEGNMQAMILYGVSAMENKNFVVAKASFGKIIKDKDNLYTDHAEWYLALCNVATGETAEAKQQLSAIVASENIYRNKAKKLMKHL